MACTTVGMGVQWRYGSSSPWLHPLHIYSILFTGCLKTEINIAALSEGFLVNNWLAREQQMLRDVGFSVFCQFNSKPM